MELDMKERLNLVRKRKGFNQEEFGKRIGVTRSAVCNYESGTRPISDQVILLPYVVNSVSLNRGSATAPGLWRLRKTTTFLAR